MVSIDALFEVLEALHGTGTTVRLDHRSGGFVAEAVYLNAGVGVSAAGDTPTEAFVSLAERAHALAQTRADSLAEKADRAAADAATAARLAIQAKRVVDGFAQGASE